MAKADPLIERRIAACTQAEEFWELLLEAVPQNSRAYLGSVLKRGAALLKAGTLILPDARLGRFCAQGSPIDRNKVVDFLLSHPSTATYYEFFGLMKYCTDDRPALYAYCQRLQREGTDMAADMASLLSLYFDLQLPAAFARRFEPYQLSRLDTSYTSFCKILKQ